MSGRTVLIARSIVSNRVFLRSEGALKGFCLLLGFRKGLAFSTRNNVLWLLVNTESRHLGWYDHICNIQQKKCYSSFVIWISFCYSHYSFSSLPFLKTLFYCLPLPLPSPFQLLNIIYGGLHCCELHGSRKIPPEWKKRIFMMEHVRKEPRKGA